MSARVVETEPGLVAIEWPMREIAEGYTRPVHHAALVTAARREAERLGLRPGDGVAIVRRVAGEIAELDALRFTVAGGAGGMTDVPPADVDKFGRPWVRVLPMEDGSQHINWTCPTCYRGMYGIVADEPVPGWDNPRWKVIGGPDGVFSLTPSLGCPGLRDGSCTGHWWYRDGKLVPA